MDYDTQRRLRLRHRIVVVVCTGVCRPRIPLRYLTPPPPSPGARSEALQAFVARAPKAQTCGLGHTRQAHCRWTTESHTSEEGNPWVMGRAPSSESSQSCSSPVAWVSFDFLVCCRGSGVWGG